MKISAGWGSVLGLAAGAAYFALEESGVPKDSNCQYLAPWTTDLIAWVGGAILTYKGIQLDDGVISFFGSAIASIHVAQYAAHKVIKNRIADQKISTDSFSF